MKSMSGYWDKAAIGLSIACTIHCLAHADRRCLPATVLFTAHGQGKQAGRQDGNQHPLMKGLVAK